MPGAGRENQKVVRLYRGAAIELDLAFLHVDARDIREHHARVALRAQQPADRNCDVTRRQRPRGDLIQQRLKDVVVRSVDNDHIYWRILQSLRGRCSAESSSDDNDARATHCTEVRVGLALMRLTSNRAAPGTPLGSCRKSDSVV
jgi:hypothetical protein